MWTKQRVRVNEAGTDPARRRVLAGGLLLLALPWLGVRHAPIADKRQASPALDAGDGFMVINGWVVPGGYFRG